MDPRTQLTPGILEGHEAVLRYPGPLEGDSRRSRAACREYRLRQEFITSYTPEQNGMIEHFSRSLKEECVWQHLFASFAAARRAIAAWIRWYNKERPHQELGYRSPREDRAQHSQLVA
jgi:putative transposase